jgi:hypothetical protein
MNFAGCIILKTLNPKAKRHRGVKSALLFLFTGQMIFMGEIHNSSPE